jgi:hypothetical protein
MVVTVGAGRTPLGWRFLAVSPDGAVEELDSGGYRGLTASRQGSERVEPRCTGPGHVV